MLFNANIPWYMHAMLILLNHSISLIITFTLFPLTWLYIIKFRSLFSIKNVSVLSFSIKTQIENSRTFIVYENKTIQHIFRREFESDGFIKSYFCTNMPCDHGSYMSSISVDSYEQMMWCVSETGREQQFMDDRHCKTEDSAHQEVKPSQFSMMLSEHQ